VSQNSKVPDPELVDKETKVLELRRAGLTWQRIAEETGYADATGAYAAYKRVIKRVQQQPADELREQELDRIDRLQLAAWPNAMKGDVRSILAIAKLMERRAKLLGLDSAIKIEQEITAINGESVGEAIERYKQDLESRISRASVLEVESSRIGDGAEEPTTA
jgi:hypothetical protein